MAAGLAFAGTFLASLVVATLAALQLADFFGAGEEFVLVIAVLALFTLGSSIAFAAIFSLAERPRTLHLTAMLMVLIALLLVSTPGLREWIAARSSNPFNTAREQQLQITLEILIPAVLAVLVQWALVRRRWLLAAGEEATTLWPLVTTSVAWLAILNPLGLAVLSLALREDAAHWLTGVWSTLVSALAGIVIVAAALECYIRSRIRRRRMAVDPLDPLARPG